MGMVYEEILKPSFTGGTQWKIRNANALSVVIISYNEERNIGRCIDSVRAIADEIILLDSWSTDKTVEIAKSKGAVVYQEKFRGYIEQKNRALQLASNNLILSIDADEAPDDQLTASILAVKKTLVARAYSMNRCTNYCGKFIRHGGWYPDRKVRLFDRRIAKWGGINPHDKIILEDSIVIQHLKGDMLHYSYYSIEEHIDQTDRFSSIAAKTLYEKGVKPGWIKILLSPVWTFISGYFIRGGLLDGHYGLMIAAQSANYTFMKYTKLQQLHKKNIQLEKQEVM